MKTNSDEPVTLYAPSGRKIVGTAESLLATAYTVVVGREPDGSIDFDYEGESKMHWDTQETRKDANGENLWTDEDGVDWPESCLSLEGEPLRVPKAPATEIKEYTLGTAPAPHVYGEPPAS